MTTFSSLTAITNKSVLCFFAVCIMLKHVLVFVFNEPCLVHIVAADGSCHCASKMSMCLGCLANEPGSLATWSVCTTPHLVVWGSKPARALLRPATVCLRSGKTFPVVKECIQRKDTLYDKYKYHVILIVNIQSNQTQENLL